MSRYLFLMSLCTISIFTESLFPEALNKYKNYIINNIIQIYIE